MFLEEAAGYSAVLLGHSGEALQSLATVRRIIEESDIDDKKDIVWTIHRNASELRDLFVKDRDAAKRKLLDYRLEALKAMRLIKYAAPEDELCYE